MRAIPLQLTKSGDMKNLKLEFISLKFYLCSILYNEQVYHVINLLFLSLNGLLL